MVVGIFSVPLLIGDRDLELVLSPDKFPRSFTRFSPQSSSSQPSHNLSQHKDDHRLPIHRPMNDGVEWQIK